MSGQPAVFARHVLTLVSAALLLAVVPGCDKAKASFKRCEVLEWQGELKAAREACREAVALSPDSKSGKAAAEKFKSLEGKISERFPIKPPPILPPPTGSPMPSPSVYGR